MFVLTADQVASRRGPDRVDAALAALAGVPTVLPFTRTVGDELQGVLDQETSVVTAILTLMRTQHWHLGLGLGDVDLPLPADSRSARGPAFIAARTAVEAAKGEPGHLRVVSAEPAGEHAAEDVEVVFHLLAAVQERRTEQGWQAVEEMRRGDSQSDAARRLGVTRQAVGQRLAAAGWTVEQRSVPVLGRLLARAEQAAGAPR